MDVISQEVLNEVRSVKYSPYVDIYWSKHVASPRLLWSASEDIQIKKLCMKNYLPFPGNVWGIPAAVGPVK